MMTSQAVKIVDVLLLFLLPVLTTDWRDREKISCLDYMKLLSLRYSTAIQAVPLSAILAYSRQKTLALPTQSAFYYYCYYIITAIIVIVKGKG